MKFLGKLLLALPLLLATLWGCAALWIDGPASRPLAGALAAGFGLACGLLLIWLRPCWRGLAGFALLFSGLLAWWLSIEPSNDRDWQPDVARPPDVIWVDEDHVTIRNIRLFEYRSNEDFDEIWGERTYDLSSITGVDLYLATWGAPLIAHTIVSWEFEDGQHLAISIETRKESHESYSALRGFFRQFELYYVVSEERDVVQVRTNFREDRVSLFRLATPPDLARAVLVDYLEEIDRLSRRPRWYNALTQNCTTAIQHHIDHVAPRNPWDWRILVNGQLDELAYERGNINTSIPFEEMQRRSDITEIANAANGAPDFSQRIRVGLPERPPQR